ncbi:MAG: ImmA/IrrE family metallo-endopeptidase [Acidobacteriota bacterium]
MQLSLRYASNDHLWFTFFHEAGHLLLHGKRLLNLEGVDPRDDSEQLREEEANAFARDFLIAPKDAGRLRKLGARPKPSKAQVRKFAADIGLAPGIVVGRMQHEGWLEYSHMNDLKVRYRWPDGEA